MRKAEILIQDKLAGYLIEHENKYIVQYTQDYDGEPISLTMIDKNLTYEFDHFPPFFEGLLPEAERLDALLRITKLERSDLFGQLIVVGNELIGAANVKISK